MAIDHFTDSKKVSKMKKRTTGGKSDLSQTRMRKRLSAAGYRGRALREALDRVAALRAGSGGGGSTVLGCDESALRDAVGSKAYKRLVAWPVVPRVTLQDECSNWDPDFVALMSQGRSTEVVTLYFQDPAQLGQAAA